jgi:hypothetical protein
MLRIVNDDRALDAGSGVVLIGTDTALVGGPGFARFGAAYARPTKVDRGTGVPIVIVDHVMVARVVTLALVALAMLWRLLRD